MVLLGFNPVRTQFVNEYGNISQKFDCVDQVGNPSFKVTSHVLLAIVSLTLCFIFLGLSNPKNNKNCDKEDCKKRTKIQKVYLFLSIILVIATVSNFFIYLYLIVTCYFGQYGKWYGDLGNTPDGIKDFNNYKFSQYLINKINNFKND